MTILFSAMLGACALGKNNEAPFTFTPQAEGAFPGVLILHTSAGLYSHEIEYAKMLTEQGYVTVVVNYFADGGLDNINKGYELLASNPKVIGKPIGIVGFSRGGLMAVNKAIELQQQGKTIDAIVAYYLGPKFDPGVKNLPPILFLHGELDNNINPQVFINFCNLQKQEGRTCEIEVFPGGKHAFDHPQAQLGGYDPVITEKANKLAFQFLNKYLKKVNANESTINTK
jgi:dienelactone hydrolase